jgi:predicted DNA-binding antitoxin AbrB/MazE fold protein
MNTQVEAVFENGVFRPLTPLDLPEHLHVMVSIPHHGTKPVDGQLPLPEQEEETPERVWRGVFNTPIEHEPLFPQPIPVSTKDLPEWTPQVTINPRWLETDDE